MQTAGQHYKIMKPNCEKLEKHGLAHKVGEQKAQEKYKKAQEQAKDVHRMHPQLDPTKGTKSSI
jgi:hypothetical protein